MPGRWILVALGTLTAVAQGSEARQDGAKLKAIHLETTVSAPPADVFAAWTTNKGAQTFFSPHTAIDARVGGAFEIYFSGDAEPGSQGSEGCRIMAIEPNKLLSFSWNAPPQFAAVRKQRTLVVLNFREEAGGKTRVALDHMGWGEGEEWDKVYAYFERAWASVLGNLRKRFDSGPLDWGEVKPRRRLTHFVYFIHPARADFIEKPTPEEQKIVGEHFQYLQQATKEGKLILAGRCLEAPWTGLVIFSGESKAAADTFTNGDPAVKAGVFKAVFHPFGLALMR
jgi:uncharacterized protein YndB with AHSA1/START domain/uncharacterized protein YciI